MPYGFSTQFLPNTDLERKGSVPLLMQAGSARLARVPEAMYAPSRPEAPQSQVHLQHRPEKKDFAQLRQELLQMQQSQQPQHAQHAQQSTAMEATAMEAGGERPTEGLHRRWQAKQRQQQARLDQAKQRQQQARHEQAKPLDDFIASLVCSVKPSVEALRVDFTGDQLLDFMAQLSRVVEQGITQLTAADREAVCRLLTAIAPRDVTETWLLGSPGLRTCYMTAGPGMAYSMEFGCFQVVIALYVLVLMRCDAEHLFGPSFDVIAKLLLGQARLARAAQSLALRDALQRGLQPLVVRLGEAYLLESPTLDSVSAAAAQAGAAAIDAAAQAKSLANASLKDSCAKALAAQVSHLPFQAPAPAPLPSTPVV